MTTNVAALHEPFTWPGAQALGISRRALDAAVQNREVRRVLRGVFVSAEVADSQRLRIESARLLLPPHSVVCDRTAAWIHGCPVFRYAELDRVPPLEVYVLRGHQPGQRPEYAGGVRDLRAEDWVLMEGVKVTTGVRTALDLGCKLSRSEGLAAMDALMRACGFSHQDLRAMLPRYRGRRGVIRLRSLIPLVDPLAESPGETWTRLAIIDEGLPPPTLQHRVERDGFGTYRLDLAYPHARIAVEYDGVEFHSAPADQLRDRRRRNWLRQQGWTVIVVTKDALSGAARHRWLRELREALNAAK